VPQTDAREVMCDLNVQFSISADRHCELIESQSLCVLELFLAVELINS